MNNLKRQTQIALIFMALLALPGCGLIEDIFAMGVWAGVIGVVLLIVIIWIIASAVKKK